MEKHNSKPEQEAQFHDSLFSTKSDARKNTQKYYLLKKVVDDKMKRLVKMYGKNGNILELGCGPHINLMHYYKHAKNLTAIDISEIAVKQSRNILNKKNVAAEIRVMDAAHLEYADKTFDVVYGKGILHHLDITNAYSEISRVLKENGHGIFMEPMGHNLFINLYRKLTPKMRSEHEHPLLMKNLELANKYFDHVKIDNYFIFSILAAFFHKTIIYRPLYDTLFFIDKIAMYCFPPIRKYAWMVLIHLSTPKNNCESS